MKIGRLLNTPMIAVNDLHRSNSDGEPQSAATMTSSMSFGSSVLSPTTPTSPSVRFNPITGRKLIHDPIHGVIGFVTQTGSSSSKRTVRRTTDAQREVLMAFFEQNMYPNTQQRKELAVRTGMDTVAVRIWFQNRRQATKERMFASLNNSVSSPISASLEDRQYGLLLP